MAGIDGQIIASRVANPSALGEGAVLAEVPHQQLNTALAAGTVDTILMKSGYESIDDYNVVVRKDLGDYITIEDVKEYLKNWTMNCGYYGNNQNEDLFPTLILKTNSSYSSSKKPTKTELSSAGTTLKGEMAIDPFDGSLYVWGNKGTSIVGVNAGTVNNYEVNRPVPPVGDSGSWLTRAEIVKLINDSFIYNSSENALTIVKSV